MRRATDADIDRILARRRAANRRHTLAAAGGVLALLLAAAAGAGLLIRRAAGPGAVGAEPPPAPMHVVMRRYDENPLAADRDYRGREVEFAAAVGAIGRTADGPSLDFLVGRIEAVFDRDDGRVYDVRRGQEVRVRGRLTGVTVGWCQSLGREAYYFRLTGCRFAD